MVTFEKRKNDCLSKNDKSNIGNWDEKIIRLCEKLNKNKNYYTTSSCAGRIILLKEEDKKGENLFLFRTHDLIKLEELRKVLDEIKNEYKGLVYFKQEPCILHVACDSLESAQKITDKAKLASWKRSGIMSSKKRFVVELFNSEGISFPIMDKGEILVDENYLKIIVKEANKKLTRTWEKINKLERTI